MSKLYVYVDGAYKQGDPHDYDPLGAAAAAIFVTDTPGSIPETSDDLHVRRLPLNPRPDSGRAALTSVILALQIALEKRQDLIDPKALPAYPPVLLAIHVEIYLDSKFAFENTGEERIKNWKRGQWKQREGLTGESLSDRDIPNKDLIMRIDQLREAIKEAGGSVEFHHIQASDNEAADRLCTKEAEKMYKEIKNTNPGNPAGHYRQESPHSRLYSSNTAIAPIPRMNPSQSQQPATLPQNLSDTHAAPVVPTIPETRSNIGSGIAEKMQRPEVHDNNMGDDMNNNRQARETLLSATEMSLFSQWLDETGRNGRESTNPPNLGDRPQVGLGPRRSVTTAGEQRFDTSPSINPNKTRSSKGLDGSRWSDASAPAEAPAISIRPADARTSSLVDPAAVNYANNEHVNAQGRGNHSNDYQNSYRSQGSRGRGRGRGGYARGGYAHGSNDAFSHQAPQPYRSMQQSNGPISKEQSRLKTETEQGPDVSEFGRERRLETNDADANTPRVKINEDSAAQQETAANDVSPWDAQHNESQTDSELASEVRGANKNSWGTDSQSWDQWK